jgi:transposase
MDVHANTISAGLLEPGWDSPVVDKMSADDESVRRLVGRFEDPGRVWACYEAGPTGYELARLLRSAGMRCEVIAPSLIPTAPGQRVKTDQRDARRLALLFRAGQLSAVRVPAPAEEAVRDLCRARADMVIDRTRARHRLGKFLLRHGRVWRGGDNWTLRHDAWIRSQRFDQRRPDRDLLPLPGNARGPGSGGGGDRGGPAAVVRAGPCSPPACAVWPPTAASPSWGR